MKKFKNKITTIKNNELIDMYYELQDNLSSDYIPLEDWPSHCDYVKYWMHDRPMIMEQCKIVENELSYRNISL